MVTIPPSLTQSLENTDSACFLYHCSQNKVVLNISRIPVYEEKKLIVVIYLTASQVISDFLVIPVQQPKLNFADCMLMYFRDL